MQKSSDTPSRPESGSAAETRLDAHAQDWASPPGSTSLWMAHAAARMLAAGEPEPTTPDAGEVLQADVCVIGGGIAGTTTALLAAREGYSVIVFDASDGLGTGETLRTTAHLASALDDRYSRLESEHGKEGAQLAARSHSFAIDLIEQICEDEGIDCAFERVTGYLIAASSDDLADSPGASAPERQVEFLDVEFAAASRAGLENLTFTHGPTAASADLPALAFPNQGQFDAGLYLVGLREAARRHGATPLRARVTKIDYGTPHEVQTDRGFRVSCAHVVVATNSPIDSRFEIHLKQEAYRTYVVGFDVPAGTIAHALIWDVLDPYHYARVAPGATPEREVLIVGGEDHPTGDGGDHARHYEHLASWARRHFPGIDEVVWQWSGQVLEPADSLGYAGRSTVGGDTCYVITGDSGHGITHGTLGAHLVTALIAGREVEWTGLYDPSRKSLRVAAGAAKQAAQGIAGVGAHLAPGEVRDRSDIPPGAGAIVRDGVHLRAVYRDAEGLLHERSATCTHLGCVVGWNAVERSWDCPCHGSRFSVDGDVLNAPATEPLARVESREQEPFTIPKRD